MPGYEQSPLPGEYSQIPDMEDYLWVAREAVEARRPELTGSELDAAVLDVAAAAMDKDIALLKKAAGRAEGGN